MNRWDTYYLGIAQAVAENSQCLSQKIGAILVNDKSIISTGYNGPPRGIPRCDERFTIDPMVQAKLKTEGLALPEELICPRYYFGYQSGQGLEYCVAGHAERNVLIQAARNGITTKDTIMYMTCAIPCKDCLVEIINAGVKEIVVTSPNYYDEASKYLTNYSALFIREYEL